MINSGYLEPITEDMVEELKEGEWIWDNKLVTRREHTQTLWPDAVEEPYGFRQIHILSDLWPRWSSMPFMLSDHDRGGYTWEYFEDGRYYRFKKKGEE